MNALFLQIYNPRIADLVFNEHGSKNSNNKLQKYRQLVAELLLVTVLADKKGLWISLRPEQSVKGTVGSPQFTWQTLKWGVWGWWLPSLPCHALTEACVDTVLANLILIVRSKEWGSSPRPPEIIKFISLAAQGFFSFQPPQSPHLSTTRTIFSRSWASQSELTGVNLSGLFSLLLPLSHLHSLPLFLFRKPFENSLNQ